MRAAIALTLGAALAVAGCQDGYPIAATHCDTWCDLVQATYCGTYNPATCVVDCELSYGGPACYQEFEDLLRCMAPYKSKFTCLDPNSPALSPSNEAIPECPTESNKRLSECVVAHTPHAPPAPSGKE